MTCAYPEHRYQDSSGCRQQRTSVSQVWSRPRSNASPSPAQVKTSASQARRPLSPSSYLERWPTTTPTTASNKNRMCGSQHCLSTPLPPHHHNRINQNQSKPTQTVPINQDQIKPNSKAIDTRTKPQTDPPGSRAYCQVFARMDARGSAAYLKQPTNRPVQVQLSAVASNRAEDGNSYCDLLLRIRWSMQR